MFILGEDVRGEVCEALTNIKSSTNFNLVEENQYGQHKKYSVLKAYKMISGKFYSFHGLQFDDITTSKLFGI